MNRSKIIAIITGAISILLAIAYLVVVQILDYRDMKPAPISQIASPETVLFLGSGSQSILDFGLTILDYPLL